MTYLSRRMREERFWSKRKPGEVTITITVDASRAVRAFARLARVTETVAAAVAEFARHAGVELDPWQQNWMAGYFADPAAVRRAVTQPTTARAGEWALRPDPAKPPASEPTPRLSWEVVVVDEYARWLQTSQQVPFDRELLSVWPNRRERR